MSAMYREKRIVDRTAPCGSPAGGNFGEEQVWGR